MRLVRLSGDVMRPMRFSAEHRKEVKLLGHCRRAIVLGVVLNFRTVDYLGCFHHCGSYYGDRDTLKTVAFIKGVKCR